MLIWFSSLILAVMVLICLCVMIYGVLWACHYYGHIIAPVLIVGLIAVVVHGILVFLLTQP